jgi:hypothetical protein
VVRRKRQRKEKERAERSSEVHAELKKSTFAAPLCTMEMFTNNQSKLSEHRQHDASVLRVISPLVEAKGESEKERE